MKRSITILVAALLGAGLLSSCNSGTDANSGASSSTPTPTPAVAVPAFSPAGGTYKGAQTVSVSCATSGATIWYTTDGSAPSTSSTRYSAAIQVASSRTLKAIATKSGMTNSGVASASYVIQ